MLSKRYHLDCLKPYKNPCVLPTTNLEFDVITHDFMSSIFSLLTDEELMQPENLIFDDWQKPAAAFTKHPEGVFEEINSGSAYKDFKNKLQDPENTIIIPIIIFGDGTVIDGAQRKPLEPFSFTLGIFWQHVWNMPQAWQNLGYIKSNPEVLFNPEEIKAGNIYKHANNFCKDDPTFVPDTKQEYHAQIQIVTRGLRKVQQMLNGMKF